MKSFQDNAGRTWCVSVNVAAIKRLRAALQIDLAQVVEDGFQSLGRTLSDPVQLVDVLWVLCQEQAGKSSVSDEDFGRAMAGDVLMHAADALLEELVDFFPDPRKRQAIRGVLDKGRQVKDLASNRLEQAMAALDPAQLLETLIGSSGGSPASSASTPTP